MKPLSSGLSTESNSSTDFQFTIKTSPHAFRILSDSLYSDKVKAVVREYLTNALDAHRASESLETPIQVTLPILDQEWAVRDFGTGLSKDQIQELFCTYFSSNKTDTNEQTGMLGLGCKSGFAYTHQFSVTSWFEGKETCYQIYLEDSVPSVSVVYEVESSEPSGLKVSIPTKQKDSYTFIQYTKEVLAWFPKSIVPEGLYEPYKLIVEEHDDMYVTTQYDTHMVLMGNVTYPLPIEFSNYINKLQSMLEKAYKKYFSSFGSFIIKAPIGSLSVLPSREGLSIDNRTRENLYELCKKCFNKYKTSITQKLKPINFRRGNMFKLNSSVKIHSMNNYTNRLNLKLTYSSLSAHGISNYRLDSWYKIPTIELNDNVLLLVVQKNTRNKYAKYLREFVETRRDLDRKVFTFKYLSNADKKRLHKWIKNNYGNKIFFNYDDLIKHIYPDGLPEVEKKPKKVKSKTSSEPKKKAKTYKIHNIFENTSEVLTVKEILAKYPYNKNTYFVNNHNIDDDCIPLVKGKTFIQIPDSLNRYIQDKRPFERSTRVVLTNVIHKEYAKERLQSILLFTLNNSQSYLWFKKFDKNSNKSLKLSDLNSYGSHLIKDYHKFLPNYFSNMGFIEFYVANLKPFDLEFVFKYTQRKLKQYVRSLGFGELWDLSNKFKYIDPMILELSDSKNDVHNLIKLLEGVADDLLRYADIARNRSVSQ